MIIIEEIILWEWLLIIVVTITLIIILIKHYRDAKNLQFFSNQQKKEPEVKPNKEGDYNH